MQFFEGGEKAFATTTDTAVNQLKQEVNVLSEASLLRLSLAQPSSKGQGFDQPERPHQHWHIDMTYLNMGGTFYYMCSIIDGYSRFIVHWEIRRR
ncbi:MAG: hypothetical protein IAE79_26065 [Anaerolinea sp.]|nr:hypothetical protein [Anaerolinea sp.]